MYFVITEEHHDNIDLTPCYDTENQINDLRYACREENLKAVNSGKYSYRLGTFYNDFIAECEKVGDYIINVVQAEKCAHENK